MIRMLQILACLTLAAVANAASNTIGMASPKAAPNQTVAVFGEFDAASTFRFWDGSTLADGTVIRQEGTTCALVIVPAGLSTGTLYLWIQDGANSVTVNAPKIWWAYPDQPEIGDTIRIFGRGFSTFSSPTMTIILKDLSGGTTYTYTSTLLSHEIAQVTIAAKDKFGATISNGEYQIYLDEWKGFGAYNGLDYTGDRLDGSTITLQAAYSPYSGTVSVADYGATPNDAVSDTEAIQSAINAADSANTGTVTFAAGTYDVDQGNGGHANLLTVTSGVHLVGQGPGVTTLQFSWDYPCTYSSSVCMSLNKFDLSVSSMTLKVTGNNFPNSRKVIQTKGADLTFKDSCYNIALRNLLFDGRNTSQSMQCGDFHCWRSVIDNVEVWNIGSFALVGRQLRVNNVRHHGSRGMHKLAGISPLGFSPQVAECLGVRDLVIENCRAGSDLWDSEYGILRRFFTSNDGYGGVTHAAIINNTVTESLTSPWAGTGENVLNETGRSILWHGKGVSVDEGTSLTLSSTLGSIASMQANGMPIVFIGAGTGFGQARMAQQRTTTVLDLDSAFTIEPDSGSSITIMWTWYDCLVSGNNLRSGTRYSEAGVGVQHWMKAYGCVTSSNTITGFAVGYLDSAMSAASSIIGRNWWAEVHDNLIQDCVIGIHSMMTEGAKEHGMLLGNTYRANRIRNLAVELPQWPLHTTNTALSINDSAWHESTYSSGVVCPIYENNTVIGAKRGFTCDQYAWMPVLRNNSFSSITKQCYVVEIGNWYHDDTSYNSMPEVWLGSVTTGDRARQVFGAYHPNPIYRYPRQMEWAIYIVSEDRAGSITTTTSDAESDAVTLTASSGLTVGGDGDVSWSDLTAGVNHLELHANDGTETATIPITIYSGGSHEPFDNLQLTAVDADTSQIVTGVRTYRMDVVRDLAGTAYSNPSEIDLSLDESTSEVKVIVCEREVKVYPTTTTAQTTGRAALFLTSNMYSQTSGTLIIRLVESVNRYYEARLHPCLNDYNKVFSNYSTEIRRVYNGILTDRVTSLTAHRCEGPIALWANNGTIRLEAWGDTYQMLDASPLAIETWQITNSTSNSSSNEYRTFDDLWFWQEAAGSAVENTYTSGTNPISYLIKHIVECTADGSGVVDYTMSTALQGDSLLACRYVPGSAADGAQLRVTLSGTDVLTSPASATAGAVNARSWEPHVVPAYSRGRSGTQPRIYATGCGSGGTFNLELVERPWSFWWP